MFFFLLKKLEVTSLVIRWEVYFIFLLNHEHCVLSTNNQVAVGVNQQLKGIENTKSTVGLKINVIAFLFLAQSAQR